MATTANTLISDAMLIGGITAPTDALTAEEAQFGLRTLNRMVDSWSNERMVIFDLTDDSFTMTPSQITYSSTLLTVRPIAIEYVFVRLNNIDFQVDLIDGETYAHITYKPVSAIPQKVYWNAGVPNGTFSFFPAPAGAYECHVGYYHALLNFADLTTTLSAPKGYEQAIVYNLAVMCADGYGKQVSPQVMKTAITSKSAVKRNNVPHPQMRVNTPLDRGLFNIIRGS
jgi:hypothetical protein